MGRGDMANRAVRARRAVDEVEELGLWQSPARLSAFLDAASELPAPTREVVVHGDLHLRHVLVADDLSLGGVIDWGDMCRGNRGMDLSIAWSALCSPDRSTFFAAYGDVDEDEMIRARVLAIHLCAALAVYEHQEGKRDVAREVLAGLSRATADL